MRARLVQLHLVIAAVFLPMALMFLITGALYTWGIKGEHQEQGHTFSLAQRLEDDPQALLVALPTALQSAQIVVPSGKPRAKLDGTRVMVDWPGAANELKAEAQVGGQEVRVTVKASDLHRRLVNLHKAHGGTVFKVWASVFALGLLTLLISGYTIAWMVPKYRRTTAVATVLGLLAALSAIALS